eukprot:1005791_1
MEDNFVKPLEKFRDTEIEYAQKLKLKCRNAKMQFDIANHNLNKAKQGTDQMKIQTCQQKHQTVNKQLMEVRSSMKVQVNRLVQTKQTSLVSTLEKYWVTYGAYSKAQANIVNQGGNVPTPPKKRNVNKTVQADGNTVTQENYNRAAMQSVAQNKQVQSGAKSAMKDKNVRNAAYNAYKSGGNDPNENRKVVNALAQNKQMQGAAVSVAKDKNVQKAAWNSAQNNAKNTYGKYNQNENEEQYDEKEEEDEFADEMDNGPRGDYNPFDDDNNDTNTENNEEKIQVQKKVKIEEKTEPKKENKSTSMFGGFMSMVKSTAENVGSKIKTGIGGPELDLKEGEYRCALCRGWGGSRMDKHDGKCELCLGKKITLVEMGFCRICHMRNGKLGVNKEVCPCCNGVGWVDWTNRMERQKDWFQCEVCQGTGLDNNNNCLCCATKGWIDGDRSIRCEKCGDKSHHMNGVPRGVFGIIRKVCPRCNGKAFMNAEMNGQDNSDLFFSENKKCPNCIGCGIENKTYSSAKTCHTCDGTGLIHFGWKKCTAFGCRSGRVDMNRKQCEACRGYG